LRLRIPLFIGIGAAIAVIIIVLLVLGPQQGVAVASNGDYSMSVRAIKDEQDLYNSYKVIISNIGKKPLTNVIVYFDDSGKSLQKMAAIYPGEEKSVSPPPDASTDHVKIITDQGLNVTKQYSTGFRIPGLRIK
jgi:hypothetical protein